MKIDASALKSCSVEESGDIISLTVINGDGQAVDLRLTPTDAHSIAMTLPALLNSSLRRKYRDDNLRYAVSLERWKVEAASDGSQIIITLSTGGGYEVSFASGSDTCSSLGLALAESTQARISGAVPVCN